MFVDVCAKNCCNIAQERKRSVIEIVCDCFLPPIIRVSARFVLYDMNTPFPRFNLPPIMPSSIPHTHFRNVLPSFHNVRYMLLKQCLCLITCLLSSAAFKVPTDTIECNQLALRRHPIVLPSHQTVLQRQQPAFYATCEISVDTRMLAIATDHPAISSPFPSSSNTVKPMFPHNSILSQRPASLRPRLPLRFQSRLFRQFLL